MGKSSAGSIIGMTAATDHPYSKADLERLIHQLVPPIVETAVDRAMSRVQSTLAADIAKGVVAAMTEQNAKLGIDTSSAAGIREAQRRNMHVDEWIANRPKHDERMRCLDEMARDFDPEDRTWVRDQRRRQERDGNTARETVIRWVVPIVLGALLAAVGFRMIEGKTPSAAPVLPVAVEQRQVIGDR